MTDTNPDAVAPPEAKKASKVDENRAAEATHDDFRYSADELVAGAAGFDTTPEAMKGALALADLTEATRADAEAALTKFNEREVD